MKIEKGKRYRCIKNPIGSRCVEIGHTYTCKKNNKINDMYVNAVDDRTDWFELVKEPSTEDLLKRIEALEKQMQPCPTAEKFKAIADHANAINDLIQNAPKA